MFGWIKYIINPWHDFPDDPHAPCEHTLPLIIERANELDVNAKKMTKAKVNAMSDQEVKGARDALYIDVDYLKRYNIPVPKDLERYWEMIDKRYTEITRARFKEEEKQQLKTMFPGVV
jgi:hypothetical protein